MQLKEEILFLTHTSRVHVIMEGSPSGCKLEATNHNAPTVKKRRAGDEADAVGNRWPHRHGESVLSGEGEMGTKGDE